MKIYIGPYNDDSDMEIAGGDAAKWQPIETAPRDGTMFLGFIDNKGEDFNEMLVMFCKHAREPFWTTHSDDHIGMNPTHWMPLPTPPERTHG